MSAHVDVNMWRVTPEGDVETTGWAYDPEETVFALMNKTKSWWDWRNYRLAYGAGRLFSSPRLVQWAQISIADYTTMTMREFFADVTLADGEGYFLMISKLVDGLSHTQNRTRSALRALYPLEAANANVQDGGTLSTLASMRGMLGGGIKKG